MWKAKVFLSDCDDMGHTHLSRLFRRLNLLPVARFYVFFYGVFFFNFLCPGSDDGSRSSKGGRWDVSKVYC